MAAVNGDEVSLERFNRLYQARVSSGRLRGGGIFQAHALQAKAEIAQQLIDEALVERAAAQRAIAIPPAQLDAAWQQFASSFPDAASFRDYSARVYGTEEEARKALRVRLLKERLAGVGDDEPSDEEARAFYEQHPSLYHAPAHLRAQAVVFLVAAGAAPDAEGAQRRRAEQFRARAAQRDVSFYLLSRQHSGDPTVRVDGFLDRLTEQTAGAAVWAALSGAAPEQVVGPVRTAEGFAVLKLLSRNPAVDKSFAEARAEIKTSLRDSRRAARLDALMRSLRAEARIENYLLTRYPPAERPAPAGGAGPGSTVGVPDALPVTLPGGPGASTGPRVRILDNR